MFINIGGMQCWQKEKPLPEEFKTYLDGAEHGAILMSFGSTINLAKIPEHYKTIFFEMVRQFPQVRFIWRWDGPLPKDVPKNLMVSKWLPQYQILSHPKLKAFISHGGLNSLTEATCHGVPVIILPLFADQDFNGFRVEAQEIGLRVEVRDLTVNSMQNAVKQLLTNDKYEKNMKKKSLLLRDRPMNPVESAVYWTEFVLRHEDTDSLKPMQHVDWFQRRMYDAFIALLLVAVAATLALIYITKAVVRRLSKMNLGVSTEAITLQAKKSD